MLWDLHRQGPGNVFDRTDDIRSRGRLLLEALGAASAVNSAEPDIPLE